MLTPNIGNRVDPNDPRPWAADTGCYSAAASFDPVHYLWWLHERRSRIDRCLFATAPDVVGDAKATLQRSKKMLPLIRSLGYPAALVAQDGLEQLKVPWETFDVLFIGGTTAWKLSEASVALMQEARRRGKGVHVGRVNSLKRMRWAFPYADSVDGTFVAFGPDLLIPRLASMLGALHAQPHLPLS